MENLTSNKSIFIKTNSSIVDDYFKIIHRNKQMNNLQFPNSVSESENLSKKSVYRPDKKTKKRPKLQKCSTTLRDCYSNKSTEISSVLFYSKEDEVKNDHFDDNLLIDPKIFYSPRNSIDNNHYVDGKITNFNENTQQLKKIERKYSWEDVRNWVPPSERKKIKTNECKIKYSWEIIGVKSQTSDTLIREFGKQTNDSNYPCKIKYSWEVIGIGTQASLHDFSHLMNGNDYWEGRIVIGSSGKHASMLNNTYESNKSRFVCSIGTQCTADKGVHTDLSDCMVKYSWQNLTKAYLRSVEFS